MPEQFDVTVKCKKCGSEDCGIISMVDLNWGDPIPYMKIICHGCKDEEKHANI